MGTNSFDGLRATALMVLLAGAAGSLAFMLYVGRRNPSIILLILFAVWVLSPFVALGFSMRRAFFPRRALYILILVLAVGSLAIYGNVALGRPRAQPAFSFLVVPLASWGLIATVALIRKLS